MKTKQNTNQLHHVYRSANNGRKQRGTPCFSDSLSGSDWPPSKPVANKSVANVSRSIRILHRAGPTKRIAPIAKA